MRWRAVIQFLNDKDNINVGVKGHQHENKALLDSIKIINGKYYIDKKALRLIEDGATVKRVEFTTNDDEQYVMRLILEWDNNDNPFAYNYIDIPIYSYYDAYTDINNSEDVEEYVNGAVLDFGVNEYKPMTQETARTNSNGYATIYPNAVYNFGKLDRLHINLAAGEDYVANIYYFSFIAEEQTQFTLPNDILWGNDNEIVIEADKRYEVCIMNGISLWTSATVEAVS